MKPYYDDGNGIVIYHGDCRDAFGNMPDNCVEMMFTDPPYGVEYKGGHFHSGDVNIVRPRESLNADDQDVYGWFMPLICRIVDGPCYCWFADSRAGYVYRACDDLCDIHAMIVWHKSNAKYAAMNAQYKQRHEPCLYFKPKGSTLRWCGPSDECTVWHMRRDPENVFHPTQKPVELAVRAIGNHTATSVIDPFCGAGSTLVAAKSLGRKAIGIEIEERYCEISAKRLQQEYLQFDDPAAVTADKQAEMQL